MTAPTPAQIHENRTENRIYTVWRNGRPYKRAWGQMSDEERAYQIEAERHAAYEDLFNPNNIY